MATPLWLQWLRGLDNHKQNKRARRRLWYKPWAELLEDRALPSTVNWINPAGGDWDTASNWSGGVVPGPNDDVTIDIPGQNNFTVSHAANVSDAVNSLTSEDALVLSGGSLSVAANSTLNSSFSLSGGSFGESAGMTLTGPFDWDSGHVAGPAGSTLLAQGGIAFLGDTGQMIVNGGLAVVNTATATWTSGRVAFTDGSTFVNAAGATFDDQTDGFFGEAGVGATFINQGLFIKSTGDATSNARIDMAVDNSGTLTVQAGNLELGDAGSSTSSGSFNPRRPRSRLPCRRLAPLAVTATAFWAVSIPRQVKSL